MNVSLLIFYLRALVTSSFLIEIVHLCASERFVISRYLWQTRPQSNQDTVKTAPVESRRNFIAEKIFLIQTQISLASE